MKCRSARPEKVDGSNKGCGSSLAQKNHPAARLFPRDFPRGTEVDSEAIPKKPRGL